MSIFLSRKYANNAGDFSRETPISRPLQNCGKRHWYGVDTEARWVKKAGKCHFGYKRHTVVNQDGLVIAEETTPANESDIKTPCNAVGESGLGTRHSRDGRQGLRLVGEQDGAFLHEAERLHHAQGAKEPQPHGTRKAREQGRKQGALCRGKDIRFDAQVVRAGVARYVGLAKTHAQHIMEAIAYNLYRTPGIIVSNRIR